MSHNSELLQQVSKISSKCFQYIENKIALDEQVSEYDLLVTCLGFIIDELKEMGIVFPINIEDILDNSNYIGAIIAIREYFDRDILIENLTTQHELAIKFESIVLSNDIFDEDVFSAAFDLCQYSNVGDKAKRNVIEYLVENTSSTSLFKKYILGVIAELPIRSEVVDSQLSTYSSLLPHVNIIMMTWKRIFKQLVEGVSYATEMYDEFLIQKYLDEYVSRWTDPKNAEQYGWMLQNGDNEDPQLLEVHHALLKRHWECTPCNLVYYIKNGPMSIIKGPVVFSCIAHEIILMLAAKGQLGADTSRLLICNYDHHDCKDIRTTHSVTRIKERYVNILHNLHQLLGTHNDDRYMQNVRDICVTITQVDPFTITSS